MEFWKVLKLLNYKTIQGDPGVEMGDSAQQVGL